MLPIGDQNEPSKGPPLVTLAFIAINLAVFFLIQVNDDAFTYGYSAIPAEITQGVDLTQTQSVPADGQQVPIPQAPGPSPIYLTLITSMFMHGGIAHIFGNMLFLWIFGDNIEDRLGHLRYIIFYLVTGVLASLAHVFTTVAFASQEASMLIPSLGASGAISGVLGGYLLLFPTRKVMVIISWFVTAVPAFIAIGLWFVFQLINGLGMLGSGSQAGGVAYAAHIGGFVAGLALITLFAIGRPPASEYQARRGYYEER